MRNGNSKYLEKPETPQFLAFEKPQNLMVIKKKKLLKKCTK